MGKLRIIVLIVMISSVTACSGLDIDSTNYPQDSEKVRREKRGKLTGDEGLKIFGGESNTGESTGALGINSYLWRATLDTISFVPLSSVDPRSGVIITDWYESPDARGERFKINVIILDTKLRTDGIRVSVFKQVLEKGNWRDAKVNEKIASDLEDKILTRAREIRIGTAR
jgi:hypothetical protein